MIIKEYYVIQNSEGKFFKPDSLTGGYPCFTDDIENCEKYNTEQIAKDFLESDYAAMFKNEFMYCNIKKVTVTIS